MDDERQLAISNREKIRKLYKSRPQAVEVEAEDSETGRPEDNSSAITEPAAKSMFGGW